MREDIYKINKVIIHITRLSQQETIKNEQRRVGNVTQWLNTCQHAQSPGFNPHHHRKEKKAFNKMNKKKREKILIKLKNSMDR
jgi:hypothetical protein